MASERWPASARYALFGLLAGVTLSWVGFGRGIPSARAEQNAAGVEANGTVAFTAGGNGTAQMLYLIDTKNQSFAVYRVDPLNAKGAVKLEATRQYRWDLKLAEYNNQPPDVSSIESMVGSPRGK